MKKATLICLLSMISLIGFAEQANEPALIPYPANLEVKEGGFRLTAKTRLIVRDKERFENEVSYLQTLLASATGHSLSDKRGNNVLEIDCSGQMNKEGYTLNITPKKIKISAQEPAGVFYAIQTLHQLILLNTDTKGLITLPALSIADLPAFTWRGSMIDVSRHFFSIDYLKRHIDRLAFYKMNKLHLHLTDDQGWRIEIKKYPELTTVGGSRSFNKQDSTCMELAKENPDFGIDPRFITEKDGKKVYTGYYTQDQLRDLVAYAAERHIEIIPEIDMPGHIMAALSAYPFLTDSEYKGMGTLFSTPLCPCKEEIYTFIENIIDEVVAIFPSQYIHIGADEVDKTTWKESELCKQLMVKEGINDFDKLQSYFIHRVQDMIESKGKKVICWDEALEGNINSNVDIMYWRGWVANAPSKAVTNGNNVIMSPTNPLYFDNFPDKSSLRNVYNMSIVYNDIPKNKTSLIKGAQGNLWTERVPSENRADFLLFPRTTALAERLWTNKDMFDSYSQRLLAHYPILDQMGVGYRLPDICGFALESVYVGESSFNITNPLKDKTIHYTTDGSVPTRLSQAFNNPLTINKPVTFKFALFSNGTAKGDIYTVNYKESTYSRPIQPLQRMTTGLTCDFYNQQIDKVSKITGIFDKQFIVKNITIPAEAKAPQFGLKYNGYINVPETGIYSFYLTCDDAGMLYIADHLVIDNEGPHSSIEKSGQVALEKGLHPFRLDFVEGGGGYTLSLQYSMTGCDMKDIPDEWFVHKTKEK